MHLRYYLFTHSLPFFSCCLTLFEACDTETFPWYLRYAKVNEVMTHCTIGTELRPVGEEPISIGFEKTFAFTGQMGPVYVFSDALSSEQVKGIYFLGPSYMYSFHGDDSLYRGILDARDGISSKIIFGFNAQV